MLTDGKSCVLKPFVITLHLRCLILFTLTSSADVPSPASYDVCFNCSPSGHRRQIKEESMVEDLNNILNAGEVPNLFPLEDKIEICEKMRVIDRQKDKSMQVGHGRVAGW